MTPLKFNDRPARSTASVLGRIMLFMLTLIGTGIWIYSELMILDSDDWLDWNTIWFVAAVVSIVLWLGILIDAIRRGRYNGWNRFFRVWERPEPWQMFF